jgi:hypothetical protein
MMSKVDTRGMSPFMQWWHKNCDAMIDDDWSAEEMAGAAWNEAQAQLTTLQQRADVAEGLARALETTEKTYLRAFRSGIPDEIWFEYFQPLVKIVKDALDAPRA